VVERGQTIVNLDPLICAPCPVDNGVGAVEPAVLAVVLTLIASISMTAISFPLLRAARSDPVSVLGEGRVS